MAAFIVIVIVMLAWMPQQWQDQIDYGSSGTLISVMEDGTDAKSSSDSPPLADKASKNQSTKTVTSETFTYSKHKSNNTAIGEETLRVTRMTMKTQSSANDKALEVI